MPYIKQEQRGYLNPTLSALIELLWQMKEEKQDGALNYCISTLLNGLYPRKYIHMNRALGVLEAAKLEYYRRVAAPYEDEKIEENGDVYS